MKIDLFMEKDDILRKGEINTKVYFIVEGIAEVIEHL